MKEKDRKDRNGATIPMGFANLDGERRERTGRPEAVFCEGKTPEQVARIMAELCRLHPEESILGTRADEKDYEALRALLPDCEYDATARLLYCRGKAPEGEERRRKETEEGTARKRGTIGVVSAGTADMPVAEEAAMTAELYGYPVCRIYDVGVAGIHRLLEHEEELRTCRVLVVVAGMEGALASVVGGLVACPVIAVPTSVGYGSHFEGLAALLSMLNSCANGVGVVNIDNGYGAACLADKILRLAEDAPPAGRRSSVERNLQMNKLYIDCTNGISSDMLLKALRALGAVGDAAAYLPTASSREVHAHDHAAAEHAHVSYQEIRNTIEESRFSPRVKEWVRAVYERIARAEAKVHGSTLEELHFHEVGRRQALEQIAGVALCLEELEVEEVLCSPVHDGHGSIFCSHGEIPVPVPAVAAMMEDCDLSFCRDDVPTEMVTPSGLGLLLGLGARCVEEIALPKDAPMGRGQGTRDTGRDGLKVYLLRGGNAG